MRTILSLIVLTVVYVSPASAQGFLEIPVKDSWTKVQDGAVIQWSLVTSDRPDTRVDLVSYLENDGTRVSYYRIRSACKTGEVASYTIKPGNKLGLGMDCDGNIVAGTSTIVEQAPALPREASALIIR